MKTRRFLALAVIAFAFVATSCDKGDDPTQDEDVFSPLTVEQNKENIEDDGIAMIGELKDLENEPAIDASASFVHFMGNASPSLKSANISNSIAFAPIYANANLSETGIRGMLRSIQVNTAEEPESIQAVYNELVGTYDWNSVTSDWDYTSGGTLIIFNFPATENGTSNNASYTASYTGYTGVNPIPDYSGDLPMNVTTSLKVGGVEISSLVVDINYDSKGLPERIETTFVVGAFEWYVLAANTSNTAFASEVSFKHSGSVILRFTLDASGNWTEDNIEANFEVKYYAEVYDSVANSWSYIEINESQMDDYQYSYSSEEFYAHKVVTSGNASFQVMNLKIVGAVDTKNLGEAIYDIDDNNSLTEEQAVNAGVEALNNYVSLSLRYASSNEVIAIVEAYPITYSDTYETNYYDGEWHDVAITVTDTYYDADLRFVFADGSKVDAETYFGEGFGDLENELIDYLEALEEAYDM